MAGWQPRSRFLPRLRPGREKTIQLSDNKAVRMPNTACSIRVDSARFESMGGGARYIYGKNSVKALLDTHPDKVFKVFLAENSKPDKRIQSIQESARNYRIPV